MVSSPDSAQRTFDNRAGIAIAAALVGIAFMGSTLLTPFYPLYRKAFGFSEITLTLIYAVYVLGNLSALLLFGGLSDRAGRRRIGLVALLTAFIGGLLFLFATGIVWLYLGRVLSGLAVGLASGTGAAWLADLHGSDGKARATLIATCANFVGLALGPLMGGFLVQYASWPLHLTFVVYLLMLAVVAFLVGRTRETVPDHSSGFGALSFRPAIGVPREIRAQFVAPAVTAFGTFALIGFYAALLPTILIQGFSESNHAIGGMIVSELFIVATVVMVMTRSLASRAAMLGGLALLLPSLAMLVAAQTLVSMPVLLAATAVTGAAGGLGYRGSLQVVNHIAPKERRAEVASSYFVACFFGNSVPVIGVGVLTATWNPIVASVTFACVIGLFAIGAIITGVRYR